MEKLGQVLVEHCEMVIGKIEKDARAAMTKHGLQPLRHPMGDGHHTDATITQEDREIGKLAFWLGGLFIDKEHIDLHTPYGETYWYKELTSKDTWTRVARALRIHGLTITNLPQIDQTQTPK